MPRDDDVVRESLGDSSRDGAHTERRDQLDADGGPRIDALQVVNKLRQILNRVDVMVRRRTYEHDARLGVAQACDQLSDLVCGQLAAFTGLGTLRDLDLNFFSVG